MTFSGVLSKLTQKEDLSPDEMSRAVEAIMSGALSTSAIESFLLLLRDKGESVAEITAAAKVMRLHALGLSKKYPDLLDTCGTGGDAKNTLNISTLSSIVACAAGAKIAKHGNRSVSSVCGSADLLEMLGVCIELSTASVERCIQETGFGFFFAPKFHPATKAVMPARKNIQGKTIFNLLGPLANPAGADYQLVGVYSQALVDVFARVLPALGVKSALIVHGLEGLDEISLSGPTMVAQAGMQSSRPYQITPEDFGFKRVPLEALQCRSKDDNKIHALKILMGEPGAGADIVCLNAGAALYAAKRALSIQEGVLIAKEVVRTGKAMQKLEQIIKFTENLE